MYDIRMSNMNKNKGEEKREKDSIKSLWKRNIMKL